MSFKFVCERVQVTGMGLQGLGMVHLGVALRSTCTYCTLIAIILEYSWVYALWESSEQQRIKTNETMKPMIPILFVLFSKD